MLVDADDFISLLFMYLPVTKLWSQVDLCSIISLFSITWCNVLLIVDNIYWKWQEGVHLVVILDRKYR